MIPRLERLSLRWGHAPARMLSRYLDGELGPPERLALEAHLSDCPDCRGLLESLTRTVEALRSMRHSAGPGVADSVIAALRGKRPSQNAAPVGFDRNSGSRSLRVVPDLGPGTVEPSPAAPQARSARRRIPHAVLGYCLRRPQLRLTLPLGLVAGVALSLINQGYMIFNGRIDVGMCAICALDFVIPFVALNVGLLLATRVASRRRL